MWWVCNTWSNEQWISVIQIQGIQGAGNPNNITSLFLGHFDIFVFIAFILTIKLIGMKVKINPLHRDLSKTIVKVSNSTQWIKMNRKCNILHLAGRFQRLYWIQIFGLQLYGISNNGRGEYKHWYRSTDIGKDGRKNLRKLWEWQLCF